MPRRRTCLCTQRDIDVKNGASRKRLMLSVCGVTDGGQRHASNVDVAACRVWRRRRLWLIFYLFNRVDLVNVKQIKDVVVENARIGNRDLEPLGFFFSFVTFF